MKIVYPFKKSILPFLSLLVLVIASCKKDSKNPSGNQGTGPITGNITNATPTQFGLYAADSSIYKLLITFVSKVGTQDVSSKDYELIFDTGSGGLVLDANGILPASMITSTGFNFTTDSTVVNGITIYNQKSTIEYGDDASAVDKVYGYLAYAPVTLGDANGHVTIKRLPFFLYYQAVDSKGKAYDPHEFDVLGVSSEYDTTFPNNAYVTSPFAYLDPGTGLTKGFKMAVIDAGKFSLNGNYVPDAVTLGLTPADLSSNGFTMHTLTYAPGDGYAPVIPVSVTYNSRTFATNAIFDTGTEPYSYIMNPNAGNTTVLLPSATSVAVSSTPGFNYSYTITDSDNLTYVENPTISKSTTSVISLEFFLNNEYLLDFTNHQLGLKNN